MNLAWIILLIGLAAGSLPAWWITADHYQGVIAQEHEEQQKLVIEQQEQNRLALLAYAKHIAEGSVQHDKDQIIINRLAANARRLRIHFPTCPVPGDTETSADSDRGARALSNALDGAFADLQGAAGSLIERCDQLNIDAIRLNRETVR